MAAGLGDRQIGRRWSGRCRRKRGRCRRGRRRCGLADLEPDRGARVHRLGRRDVLRDDVPVVGRTDRHRHVLHVGNEAAVGQLIARRGLGQTLDRRHLDLGRPGRDDQRDLRALGDGRVGGRIGADHNVRGHGGARLRKSTVTTNVYGSASRAAFAASPGWLVTSGTPTLIGRLRHGQDDDRALLCGFTERRTGAQHLTGRDATNRQRTPCRATR